MNTSNETHGKDARRIAFLEAAWHLLAERGYHRVRVQDIARLCGTSTGAVHYYFPGKEDILREALKYSVDKALERQTAPLKMIKDARKRLLALLELQLPIGAQVRAEWLVWLQFWTEASLNPELRGVHSQYYIRWVETVIRIVQKGQAEGTFLPGNAEMFARRYVSMIDGAAIQILTGVPGMTPELMREMVVSLINSELGLGAGSNQLDASLEKSL